MSPHEQLQLLWAIRGEVVFIRADLSHKYDSRSTTPASRYRVRGGLIEAASSGSWSISKLFDLATFTKAVEEGFFIEEKTQKTIDT